MKKLLLCAVFSTAGFMFTNAQTVKATAKTEMKPATEKILEKTTEKTESQVSQILKGTHEHAEKTEAQASQAATSVVATTAAQNAVKTDVNLKADANVNAQENANSNAAITTQTDLKVEPQPADKAVLNKEAKAKSKVKVD